MHKLKSHSMDLKQVLKTLSDVWMDGFTEGLVDCMWTWWSSDRCFYIGTCSCTWTHCLVQMDSLQRAGRCTWTTWDHHSDGYQGRGTCWGTWMMCYVCCGCLSRWTCCCTWTEPGLLLCLLWMPQQMDCCCTWTLLMLWMLLKFMLCLLQMPQQMDLLLHMDIVKVLLLFCYVIITRLVVEAAVSTISNMCHLCMWCQE